MSDFEALFDFADVPREIEIIQYDTGDVLFAMTEQRFGRVLHAALRECAVLPAVDCAGREIHRFASLTDDPQAQSPAGGSMPGAQFRDARLMDCWLHGLNLRGANFRRAMLMGVCFSNCDLRGADFTGCRFLRPMGTIPTCFAGADLHGARFSRHSDLTYADFTGASHADQALIVEEDGSPCPMLYLDPQQGKIVSHINFPE